MTTGLLILGFGILLATIAVLVVFWRRTRRWEWLLLAFSLFVLPYALNVATRNTASEAKRAAEARNAGEEVVGFSYPVSLIASGELGLVSISNVSAC